MTIYWRIGALSPKLREQAEAAGAKLNDADLCQDMLDNLLRARINGIITDGEWNKILPRFMKKVVEPRLEEKE